MMQQYMFRPQGMGDEYMQLYQRTEELWGKIATLYYAECKRALTPNEQRSLAEWREEDLRLNTRKYRIECEKQGVPTLWGGKLFATWNSAQE